MATTTTAHDLLSEFNAPATPTSTTPKQPNEQKPQKQKVKVKAKADSTQKSKGQSDNERELLVGFSQFQVGEVDRKQLESRFAQLGYPVEDGSAVDRTLRSVESQGAVVSFSKFRRDLDRPEALKAVPLAPTSEGERPNAVKPKDNLAGFSVREDAGDFFMDSQEKIKTKQSKSESKVKSKTTKDLISGEEPEHSHSERHGGKSRSNVRLEQFRTHIDDEPVFSPSKKIVQKKADRKDMWLVDSDDEAEENSRVETARKRNESAMGHHLASSVSEILEEKEKKEKSIQQTERKARPSGTGDIDERTARSRKIISKFTKGRMGSDKFVSELEGMGINVSNKLRHVLHDPEITYSALLSAVEQSDSRRDGDFEYEAATGSLDSVFSPEKLRLNMRVGHGDVVGWRSGEEEGDGEGDGGNRGEYRVGHSKQKQKHNTKVKYLETSRVVGNSLQWNDDNDVAHDGEGGEAEGDVLQIHRRKKFEDRSANQSHLSSGALVENEDIGIGGSTAQSRKLIHQAKAAEASYERTKAGILPESAPDFDRPDSETARRPLSRVNHDAKVRGVEAMRVLEWNDDGEGDKTKTKLSGSNIDSPKRQGPLTFGHKPRNVRRGQVNYNSSGDVVAWREEGSVPVTGGQSESEIGDQKVKRYVKGAISSRYAGNRDVIAWAPRNGDEKERRRGRVPAPSSVISSDVLGVKDSIKAVMRADTETQSESERQRPKLYEKANIFEGGYGRMDTPPTQRERKLHSSHDFLGWNRPETGTPPPGVRHITHLPDEAPSDRVAMSGLKNGQRFESSVPLSWSKPQSLTGDTVSRPKESAMKRGGSSGVGGLLGKDGGGSQNQSQSQSQNQVYSVSRTAALRANTSNIFG